MLLWSGGTLLAINVTIPYKQLVIPYCDVVDPKSGGHRRGEYHRQPGWQTVRL